MNFKLIVSFVNPQLTEKVIEYAKQAGATGDVILSARGTGSKEVKLFGVSVENKTDVILFAVEEHIVSKVLDAIVEHCDLKKPGNGIAIVLNIERVAGLESQIEQIKQKLREEQL